jgi:phage terminase large subunit GpA-like protein
MSHVDREKNRAVIGRTDLAIVWTTYWQDVTAAELEAGPGRGRNVVHLPANAPAYLYRHLTAERKVAVKGRNGQMSYIWKPVHSDNHLRDCLVYSRAAAGIKKADKMQPMRSAPLNATATPLEPEKLPILNQSREQPQPKRESALARMLRARAGDGGSIQMRRI